MDTVQSLLGMSPAAAPQHQAGTVSVSAHEVQQPHTESRLENDPERRGDENGSVGAP
eukprot:COSAG04_NODE_25350_length_308_cov_6.143541_2_plen_57_part_01